MCPKLGRTKSMHVFMFTLIFLFGMPVLAVIGLGLIELSIEFFTSPPPGMGVVYRTTPVSDAITKALQSEEKIRHIRTRPRIEEEDSQD